MSSTLAEGLLDGLLSDALPEPVVPPVWPGSTPSVDEAAAERDVARGLADHRGHRQAWYGDLVGPLVVPALSAGLLHPGLARSDVDLPVLLAAPRDRDGDALAGCMRAARAQLLDDDRVALIGVELPLPGDDPAAAAQAALDGLDSSGPAWLRLPASVAWLPALEVILADGAEHITLETGSPVDGFDGLAVMLHRMAARTWEFAVEGPGPALVTTDDSVGLLNLLVAVEWVVTAPTTPEELARALADRDAEAVVAAALEIEAVTAVRRRLGRITCTSVRALVEDLETAGLIEPDVA